MALGTGSGQSTGTQALRGVDTRDAMGRVTQHSEYQSNGATVAYSRTDTFDAKGQVLTDDASTLQSGGAITRAVTTNSYVGGAPFTILRRYFVPYSRSPASPRPGRM